MYNVTFETMISLPSVVYFTQSGNSLVLRKVKLLLHEAIHGFTQQMGNSKAICNGNLCLRTYFVLITSDCCVYVCVCVCV